MTTGTTLPLPGSRPRTTVEPVRCDRCGESIPVGTIYITIDGVEPPAHTLCPVCNEAQDYSLVVAMAFIAAVSLAVALKVWG